MHSEQSIELISKITENSRIDLPEEPGVYAFWWVGPKETLMNSNRHIVLRGPNQRPLKVEYIDWWPPELKFPCLYVGKSTNIKKKFSNHLKRGSPQRLHPIADGNLKQKPATTSCQLRHGIEHLFENNSNPLDIINNSVGFSYSTNFDKNATAERFFTEDRLIGTWRPWFNIDSKR